MATAFELALEEIIADRNYRNSTDYAIDMVNKAQAEQRAKEALLPKREAVQEVVPQKVEEPDYTEFVRTGMLWMAIIAGATALVAMVVGMVCL